MHRKPLTLVIVFSLAVHSGQSLKCYMCNSLTNEACSHDPGNGNMEPIECTPQKMENWSRDMKADSRLVSIASIFDVDVPQYHQDNLANMACTRMDLKVAGNKVMVRSCQIAKMENVDPCRVIKTKLSTASSVRVASVESCSLCETDACNSAVIAPPNLTYLLFSLFGTIVVQALRYRIA